MAANGGSTDNLTIPPSTIKGKRKFRCQKRRMRLLLTTDYSNRQKGKLILK